MKNTANGTALWLALIFSMHAADADSLQDQQFDVRKHCGSYCLYLSLRALDLPVGSVAELEEKLGGPPGPQGYSMNQLQEAAKSCGAHVLAVQTTFDNLKRRPQPFACIAHINDNHFVNFGGFSEDGKTMNVFSPPQHPSQVPVTTLQKQWSGKALLISTLPLAAEHALPRPWDRRYLFAAVVIILTLITAAVFLREKFRKDSQRA